MCVGGMARKKTGNEEVAAGSSNVVLYCSIAQHILRLAQGRLAGLLTLRHASWYFTFRSALHKTVAIGNFAHYSTFCKLCYQNLAKMLQIFTA